MSGGGNSGQLRFTSVSRHLVEMDRWTGEHRGYAVKAYYTNGESLVKTRRAFRRHFNIPRNRPVPSDKAIRSWINNLEQTGSTSKKRGGSAKTVRTPQNIATVQQALLKSPRRSAKQHALRLGISNTSVRRILHKDLNFHPYKIQIVQSLKPTDNQKRLQFCEEMARRLEENVDQVNNLWMSDEAHFHLSGFVNKQNFRYWSEENPGAIHEKPLHAEKVTVWCAMSARGIIGPFFFEDINGSAVTVNSVRYVAMIQNFLTPQLARFAVNEHSMFQQDGATSHTARVAMNAVKALFPGGVISRNGDIPWPPRSPDLTACDFFLWGYLKTRVFQNDPPRTIAALKQRIRHEIEGIPVNMLQNVMRNFQARLQQCIDSNGGHLANVIFKK